MAAEKPDLENEQQQSAPAARELLEPPSISPLERRLLVGTPLHSCKPDIQKVPASSVLDRVRNFLPQLEEANKKLEQQMQGKDPREFDIEAVQEDEKATFVQMDLACGLLELKDAASVLAAERAMQAGVAGPGCIDEDSDSEDSTEDDEVGPLKEDDDDDDDDDDDVDDNSQHSCGSSDDGPDGSRTRRKKKKKSSSRIQPLS